MLFAVALLFHTSPTEKPDEHILWEERIVLIEADDEDEAAEKAKILANEEGFEYENALGVMVKSKFECVERVYQISEPLKDGCEIFSRFLRDSEARSLLTPFDD